MKWEDLLDEWDQNGSTNDNAPQMLDVINYK
jgi:hypothetical protein